MSIPKDSKIDSAEKSYPKKAFSLADVESYPPLDKIKKEVQNGKQSSFLVVIGKVLGTICKKISLFTSSIASKKSLVSNRSSTLVSSFFSSTKRPIRAQKESAMTKISALRGNSSHAREAGMALLALTAITLVACGGGGGGSTPAPVVVTPPPTPLATVTLTDKTVTVAGVVTKADPIKFGVAVSGNGVTAVTAKVTQTCDGKDVALTTSTVPVTGGDVTALPVAGEWPSGAVCTYKLDATATNSGGSASATQVASAFQVKFAFPRLNLVVFADQSGYLGLINDATGKVTPLINKTGYTDGIDPIRLCGVYDDLFHPAGMPMATCVTRFVGNTRRNFPINPLTGELMAEYTGAVPAGAVWRDVNDGNIPAPANHVAHGVFYFGMYIDVPTAGTYFFTGTDQVNLRLTKDAFATNKVIATCGSLSCFKYLKTFSNP